MEHTQRSKGSGSIYQNSRGQWVATIEAGWTERGTRRRLTLKARTEAAIRVRLAEAQRRIAAEGLVTSFATITVKRWTDQWLTQRQLVVRPGTYVSDRSAVNRWIVPTLGHLRLDALVPADVRKVASVQEGAGLALPTMQRTHAVLGKILADAVAEGYQVSQRARETSGPGLGVSTRQALSVDDTMRIIAVVATRPDASRWVAALVEGLRPAEALGLTWDMVDLEAATIRSHGSSRHYLTWSADARRAASGSPAGSSHGTFRARIIWSDLRRVLGSVLCRWFHGSPRRCPPGEQVRRLHHSTSCGRVVTAPHARPSSIVRSGTRSLTRLGLPCRFRVARPVVRCSTKRDILLPLCSLPAVSMTARSKPCLGIHQC